MLGNCGEEKMILISPTTNNQWPQIDEKRLMTMEKSQAQAQSQAQAHPPPQQQALKCPRCDSSNTKFCYYNNYSLSQPRHFCKACKRYWTRGGTLRNVPVGGGCRKNKRVKLSSSAVDGGAATTPTPATTANPSNLIPSSQPPHNDVSSAQNHVNPLFYGLPTNPSDHMNLPFQPRFSSKMDTVPGFDLQPQLNGLGLGFMSSSDANNGFNVNVNPQKQIQESLLSNYSIFGSTSPSIASLLGSTLHQQHKFNIKETSPPNQFHQNLTYFEDLHMNGESGISMKEVKIEQEQQNSRFHWNQIDQIGFSSSDPSIYWNPTTTSSVGPWHDPANNIGSSVTSLI